MHHPTQWSDASSLSPPPAPPQLKKGPPLTVRQHPGADMIHEIVTLEISLSTRFDHKWTRESSDLRKTPWVCTCITKFSQLTGTFTTSSAEKCRLGAIDVDNFFNHCCIRFKIIPATPCSGSYQHRRSPFATCAPAPTDAAGVLMRLLYAPLFQVFSHLL